MVEYPSYTTVYRCKLRDGVVNDKVFFVNFFRVRVFCWIAGAKIGKLDFLSSCVFQGYIEVVHSD